MIESGQAVVVTREVEMRQWADQVEKSTKLVYRVYQVYQVYQVEKCTKLVYRGCLKVPCRIHLYDR